MPLAKFEFSLFKTLIQLEEKIGLKNNQILLNLQVSGGKDSMGLLFAFVKLMSSSQVNFNNKYVIVAQHFNHKQRVEESEEDAVFVAKECAKLEIPFYLHSLQNKETKENTQNFFRNWRKKEAINLSENLTTQLNCNKYFIVTAHHARDHAETILIHILRGSGLDGLKGIQLLDEKKQFLRPFANLKYAEIDHYVQTENILFREDSSNLDDKKYTRNYIRHNILPHFQHLFPDYENSFLKLSRNVNEYQNGVLNKETEICVSEGIVISTKTTSSSLFYSLKNIYNIKSISENSLKNILHEASLLSKNKNFEGQKEVLLSHGRKIFLCKSRGSTDVTLKQI